MLQAASSAGVMGVPRFGPSAKAPLVQRNSAMSLQVNMAHASARVDGPARRTVVVLADEGGRRHDARALAPVSEDLGAGRVRIARVVPRARKPHRRPAVP